MGKLPLYAGKMDLDRIAEYISTGAYTCLEECTDKFHDDTCVVAFAERVREFIKLLPLEPNVCKAQKWKVK